MAHDSPDSPQPPPRASNRLMLFAGVAGACALGVGAGLWARPADTERDPRAMQVAKAPAPEKPAGKLQIVVDEAPAPIGKPIEVLPGAEPSRPAFVLPPPPAEPEPIAPRRPPEGLVRVQAVTPPAPQVDRAAERLASQQLAERAARAEQARLEKIKAEKAEQARLEKVRLEKVRLEKVRLEKVRAQKAEAARAEKVRLEKVKLQKTKLDKAERAKIERQARAEARAELLAEQKAAKARQVKLAKAKAAKAEAAELAEAKRSALTKLARALTRVAHHEKPTAAPAKKKVEPVRGEGPLRLASYKNGGRCVNADPGAAIVCADPALGAADRRLARAYQEAQAAGVSPAQLKRQQDRWLAARSAAAREAPWAVHDVYLARIAELNDQARDARGGGY
jgi:hypothetical protein